MLACAAAMAGLANRAGATEPAATAPQQVFADNCAACHGDDARGVKDQGVDLTTSDFVKRMDDDAFAAFLMVGRQPAERGSRTGQLMPAFDYLTPEETRAAIAFVRARAK
jgi:mono/diheme cytochrome c family protein